jgi:3,4-dihydroxy 2-butanone 4-phosphate synthase/GTP cyclohydrolase II
MAGLIPAGVICEIMNEDGTMARLPDLIKFAQYHGLKIGTIADLIAYRRRTETIVERSLTTPFTSMHGGEFTMHIYVNKVAYAEHVALVKGDLTKDGEPPLVRMHALNVLEDVLGDRSHSHGGELQASMRMIAEAGRGVIILLREAQAASLSQKLIAQMKGMEQEKQLRDYGVGAQILLDLGVCDMVLLSNAKRVIVGLEGYGLRVVEQRPLKI